MNQVPVNFDAKNVKAGQGWPCPKAVLYAQRAMATKLGAGQNANYNHPVYDEKLRSVNPVPAGVGKHQNGYSYVFVATYEDNVESGWNPEFVNDTTRIRCRGPFLVATPERLLNIQGRLEQLDHVLIFSRYYYVDGAEFAGYALEAATWQVHTSATRATDRNLFVTLSGK
jgi:hypothetical protein